MKFCTKCGTQLSDNDQYCPSCGTYNGNNNSNKKENDEFWSKDMNDALNTKSDNVSPRSRLVAALLAFFLGGIGIHQFYLGKTRYGVLMLLFCWTGVPAIIALVNLIMILMGSETDAEGRELKAW